MDSIRTNTFTYLVNSPEYNHLAQSVQMPSSAHFSLTTRTAPLSMRAPSLLCWSLLTVLGSWFLIPDSPTTPSPAPCPLSRHSALTDTLCHPPTFSIAHISPGVTQPRLDGFRIDFFRKENVVEEETKLALMFV